MQKCNNINRFSALACAVLLLVSCETVAGGNPGELPVFGTENYGLRADADIDERTRMNEINLFSGKALGSGQVIWAADAEAHIMGDDKSHKCFALTGAIACRISGPAKVMMAYWGNARIFEFENTDYGVCYAGHRGIFCDAEKFIDIKAGAKPLSLPTSLDHDSKDYHVKLDFDLSVNERVATCIHGFLSDVCVAFGPMHIDVIHEETKSGYDLKQDERALCYSGPLGAFCDLYDLAKQE